MKKLLTFAAMFILVLAVNAQVTVTFNLDMSVEDQLGNLSAGDTLSVNGTFNNWTAKANLLTDPDGDKVYTGTASVAVGDTIEFKFWWSAFDGQWEPAANRKVVVTGDMTLDYFWNNVASLPAPISVTFQCNMEFEIVSGRFNPETDTLTVRGAMNGWASTDILEPTALNPSIYEFTYMDTLAVDEEVGHKFAYMTAAGITGWEGGSDKFFSASAEDFAAGFLVVSRAFNDATAADLTGQETTITFTVDMNGAVDGNLGTPFSQIDNVIIAGASPPLNWPSGGWPTTDQNLVHFLNDGGTDGDAVAGDGIWSINLTFPKYSLFNVEYKYGANWGTANNGGSNDNEGGVGDNHWIKMTSSLESAKVENVFGEMATSEDPHPLVDVVNASATVTFNLDMSVEDQLGNLSAGDTLSVNGTFNNWTAKANLLTDPDGDKVYTGTASVAVGDTIEFKFWWSAFDGQWEPAANRKVVVTGDMTLDYFWNNVASLPAPISVTFQCNMEFEIVSGRFNPETDTLTVRGAMNGWASTDILEPTALNPSIYEFTYMDTLAVDEEVGHKFAYMTAAGITGWEGGSDKFFSASAEDFAAGFLVVSRAFNDATAADLTGQETTITFTVDMNGAVDGNLGTPFSQIDNVIIAGASPPLNWPSGGWPTTDQNLVHFLNDGGTDGDAVAGDGIWSINLTFPKYSLLNVEYKYGANWGTANNGGSNDNEGGVGDNHWIHFTTDLVSGTVANEFGVMATSENPHPLVDVVVGVNQDGDEIPLTFAIEQNYPNPFNPSTTIKFSIPEQANVSLKIYNMLGQEVVTLVDEQMSAGRYDVKFDASSLSSGIYFYSIQAGQFNVTKKMMLIK